MMRAMKKAGVLSILFVVVLLAVAVIAKAQQPTKMSRIGFIGASSAATSAQNLEAFRQGLRDLHYIAGLKGLPNASPSSSPS
jgi:ABC-type phosphate/phosphonate transport system substrate-binding protein